MNIDIKKEVEIPSQFDLLIEKLKENNKDFVKFLQNVKIN